MYNHNSERDFSENGSHKRESHLRKSIGEMVRYYRTHYEVNSAKLAKAAGISPAMLSQIENGTVSPSLTTLRTLATALGVSITAFLKRSEEPRRAMFIPKSTAGTYVDLSFSDQQAPGEVVGESNMIFINDLDEMRDYFHHESTYFLYCIDGSAKFRYNHTNYNLSRGDCLLFSPCNTSGVLKARGLPACLLRVRLRGQKAPMD
jgi:transcriptional regulator with XRE-family HTH domain